MSPHTSPPETRSRLALPAAAHPFEEIPSSSAPVTGDAVVDVLDFLELIYACRPCEGRARI